MKRISIHKLKINFLRIVEKLPGVNLQQAFIYEDCVYVIIPKCGTRTIRDHIMNIDKCSKAEANRFLEYVNNSKLKKLSNSKDIYLYTRHPLERLISCWKQKITSERDKGPFYYFQYYPLLKPNMSFYEFLCAVHKIPPLFSEKHFRPISITVDQRAISSSIKPLKKLDKYLNILSKKNRSNTTKKYHPSELEIDFYEKKLSSRFQKDLYYYNLSMNDDEH